MLNAEQGTPPPTGESATSFSVELRCFTFRDSIRGLALQAISSVNSRAAQRLAMQKENIRWLLKTVMFAGREPFQESISKCFVTTKH